MAEEEVMVGAVMVIMGLIGLVALGFLVSLAWLAIRVVGRRRQAWRELAQALGGRTSGENIFGAWQERPFALTWRRGRDKSPPLFRLRMLHPTPISFRISRRHDLLRLGEWLGMLTDVPVGDEAFDRRYLLRSSQPEAVRRLFADRLDRSLVEELICCDTCTVSVGFGRIELHCRAGERGRLQAERVGALLTAMQVLGDGLPSHRGPVPRSSLVPERWLTTAVVLAVALSLVGWGLVEQALAAFPPEIGWRAVGLGLLAGLGGTVVGYVPFRALLFACDRLPRLAGTGAGMLGMGVLAAGGALLLNGQLDGGEPAVHEVAVRGIAGGGLQGLRVQVDDWRGEGKRELVVHGEAAGRIARTLPRPKLAVEVRPGALGVSWIAGAQDVPSAEPTAGP